MRDLQRWHTGAWGQFLAGLILLGMLGGKKKFWSLFRKNIVVWTYIFFDALSVPIVAAYWINGSTDFSRLCYFLATLYTSIAVYSLIRSIFAIPNCIPEHRHLDKAISQFNPLRVFITVPLRWMRRVWTERS